MNAEQIKQGAAGILRVAIISCLLAASGRLYGQASVNDVTAEVEQVGNPFAAHFPTGDRVYARNVWDMVVFDDRLYFGHGNSDNAPPVPNAGPIDVWSYDGKQFTKEYTVDDEEIERFVIINGDLYIPGRDTRTVENVSNIYRLHNGQWNMLHTVPDTQHVYDLASYNGQLYAAINGDSTGLLVSGDEGQTWQPVALSNLSRDDLTAPTPVVWELFPLGDSLMMSLIPSLKHAENDPANMYTAPFSATYRLNAQKQVDEVQQNLVPSYDKAIVARNDQGYRVVSATGRVARPTAFLGREVYIGALVDLANYKWRPLGLYSIGVDLDVQSSDLGTALPWDLRVDGNTLYVLTNEIQDNGQFVVAVMATHDLETWTEILRFESPAFARSFALYHGDFYFGLGSEATAISPETGNIVRVKAPLNG